MAKKSKTAPPESSIHRAWKILGAGLKIASKEAGQAIQSKWRDSEIAQELTNKVRTEQIRILTQTLSQLKGGAMKFGQMLSLDAQDLLPPEALEILSSLQNKAQPVESEILFRQIKNELGENKFLDLQLESEPLATASIGQVFKGRLHDKSIVVKVQYPGIANTVDSDIALLKRVLSGVNFLVGKKIEIDEVLEEIRYVLKNEVNYRLEAEHVLNYQKMLKDKIHYCVPNVFLDYCGEQVLTLSFERGLLIKDWLKTRPDYVKREKIGHLLLDLYCVEFFENGFVQTDPNLANFLINEESGLQIVLLDFGAVLRYSNEFRGFYQNLLQIMVSDRPENIIQFCLDKKLIDERESKETQQKFLNMLKVAIMPFRDENQPFHFSRADYSDEIRRVVLSFIRAAKYSPPPRELIFLHRKLGGIFNILKMMDLKIDLRPYKERMIKNEL